MKDYKRQLEQISQALHEHDLHMIERRYYFLAHQHRYEEFCELRAIHAEWIGFWRRVVAQLQERHRMLETQAYLKGW